MQQPWLMNNNKRALSAVQSASLSLCHCHSALSSLILVVVAEVIHFTVESLMAVPVEADLMMIEQDELYVEAVDSIEQGEFSPSTATLSTATRKKRSLVWTYFHEGQKNQDTCSETIVTSGNTTNMVKVHQESRPLKVHAQSGV